jgi:Rho-binding antiterminator
MNTNPPGEAGHGPAATPAGDYRPIDCDVHDRYELAALHREELVLEWLDEGGEVHTGHVRVDDVETRENGEFLRGQLRSGSPLEVRLDRVLRHSPS